MIPCRKHVLEAWSPSAKPSSQREAADRLDASKRPSFTHLHSERVESYLDSGAGDVLLQARRYRGIRASACSTSMVNVTA
jgi:hypothetical protein